MNRIERIAAGLVLAWLALVLTIVGLALNAGTARAAEIPSSVSGAYLAPDRVCWLVYQRYQVHWVQVEVRCQYHGSGGRTEALTTLWAPNGQCPTELLVVPFIPSIGLGGELFAVRGMGPESLHVLVGTDPTALANGVGVSQEWVRIESVASPVPYTCAAPPPTAPPVSARSRDLVCRVNPTAPSCGH